MPWDVRGDRRYYYRSRREGKRAFRTYVGTGAVGEAAAAAVEAARAERQAAIDVRRDEQASLKESEAPLRSLCALTDQLMKASLVAVGYHQHDHGEWRKRKQGSH